jgi:hypothetical protein
MQHFHHISGVGEEIWNYSQSESITDPSSNTEFPNGIKMIYMLRTNHLALLPSLVPFSRTNHVALLTSLVPLSRTNHVALLPIWFHCRGPTM